MKISRVEVLCANRAVYAKVYTDNGLYGIGESGAWGLLAASGEAIKMFGEYLVGQDRSSGYRASLAVYVSFQPFPWRSRDGRDLCSG